MVDMELSGNEQRPRLGHHFVHPGKQHADGAEQPVEKQEYEWRQDDALEQAYCEFLALGGGQHRGVDPFDSMEEVAVKDEGHQYDDAGVADGNEAVGTNHPVDTSKEGTQEEDACLHQKQGQVNLVVACDFAFEKQSYAGERKFRCHDTIVLRFHIEMNVILYSWYPVAAYSRGSLSWFCCRSSKPASLLIRCAISSAKLRLGSMSSPLMNIRLKSSLF